MPKKFLDCDPWGRQNSSHLCVVLDISFYPLLLTFSIHLQHLTELQDECLNMNFDGEETPLNPASDFSPEEEQQCDAEVEKITGTTDGSLAPGKLLPSKQFPPSPSSAEAVTLNNNNNNRKDSMNSPPDVECVEQNTNPKSSHSYQGNNQQDRNNVHGNHLDNSGNNVGSVPGVSDDCSTNINAPSSATTQQHGLKDDVIEQKHGGGTSQQVLANTKNIERDESFDSLSEATEHFV